MRSDTQTGGAYRSNVGVVLFNGLGQVFLGKRTPDDRYWQFPQGGIDSGEDPADAASRELEEETGAPRLLCQALGETEGWLAYDFPPDVRAGMKNPDWKGQRQKWFAFRFLGRDSDIDLAGCASSEFCEWRWGRLEDAPSLVIPWKRDVYEQVARVFARFAHPV